MRFFLIWQILTFDADTTAVDWRQGQEEHVSADACRAALSELQTITGNMVSRCVWVLPDALAPALRSDGYGRRSRVWAS